MTRKTFANVYAGIALVVGLLTIVSTTVFFPDPLLRASEQTVTAQRLINTKSASGQTGTVGGPMANCRETAIYVDWGAGVASGVVTVETAVDQNYTGTWAPLSVVTFAATAPKQDVVQITGVHWAIRTRISTIVAGGTINTWLVCN